MADTDIKRVRDMECQKVSLDTLSSLTNFPKHFIKKELLIEEEEILLKELRSLMLRYLENCSKEIKKTFVLN